MIIKSGKDAIHRILQSLRAQQNPGYGKHKDADRIAYSGKEVALLLRILQRITYHQGGIKEYHRTQEPINQCRAYQFEHHLHQPVVESVVNPSHQQSSEKCNHKRKQDVLVAHGAPQGDAWKETQEIAGEIMLGSILLHQSPYGSLYAHQEQSDDGTAQYRHIIELYQKLTDIVSQSSRQHNALQEIVGIKEKHLILFLKAESCHIRHSPKQHHCHAEEQRQQRFPSFSDQIIHFYQVLILISIFIFPFTATLNFYGSGRLV